MLLLILGHGGIECSLRKPLINLEILVNILYELIQKLAPTTISALPWHVRIPSASHEGIAIACP